MKEIKKKEEVERFLKQFLPKLDIWGIINPWPAQQQDYLYLVPRVRIQNRLCIQKQKRR